MTMSHKAKRIIKFIFWSGPADDGGVVGLYFGELPVVGDFNLSAAEFHPAMTLKLF